jgi:hypothetical protein
MKKIILIPLKFIKFENGMWFYVLPLMSRLLESGSDVFVWCHDWQKDHLKNLPFKRIHLAHLALKVFQSYFDKSIIVISPTLRPLFAARQYVIMHDAWPLMQPNHFKKFISNLLYKIARRTSSLIFVSNNHKSIYGKSSDLLYYNEIPDIPLKIKENHIYCDILLIGTETKRKQIEKIDLLLKLLINCGLVISNPIIIVIGTVTPKISSKYRVNFMDSKHIYKIRPTKSGAYISASLEEGFNRGAAIAKQLGFNLFLSDIGAHKEFFPEALFFNKAIDHPEFYKINGNHRMLNFEYQNNLTIRQITE